LIPCIKDAEDNTANPHLPQVRDFAFHQFKFRSRIAKVSRTRTDQDVERNRDSAAHLLYQLQARGDALDREIAAKLDTMRATLFGCDGRRDRFDAHF
jgi:hypothetical protein